MHWKSVCVVHVSMQLLWVFSSPFFCILPHVHYACAYPNLSHTHISNPNTYSPKTCIGVLAENYIACKELTSHIKTLQGISRHRHIQWPCHLSCKGRSEPWSTFIVGDFVNPCSPLPENTSLTKNIITSSSYAALKRKMRWQSATRWSIWIKGVNAVVATAPSGGDSLN